MKKLLFILWFSPCFMYAQQTSLYFDNLSVQHGLSHPKVNCIIQDQRGFTWIGTDDGLNRYDGKNFIHFRHRQNDTNSISGNIITDMLQDKEGRIWIATGDGGLSCYDYRLAPQKQFKQYSHSPGNSSSLPVNAINTLLDDNEGYLWLGTSGKLVLRFHKNSGNWLDVTKSRSTALDLCRDKDGIIWVGKQGGGIMRIHPRTLTVTEDERYKNFYAHLPHATVTALYKDSHNDMWFGSWDKILYRYNSAQNTEQAFRENTAFSFQNDEILSFAEDNGRLWMGGKDKGLHIYDTKSQRFFNYRFDPSKDGSIGDNRINCIYKDKQNRVWLGTNKGISINQREKQQFVQQFLPGTVNAAVNIFDFYEDEQENIWIGTSQGIYVKNKTGSIIHHPLFYKGKSLQVSCFFKDGNDFYIGTQISLFKFNPVTKSVTLLPNTEKDGVMKEIINSRILSILKDTIDGRPVLIALPYGHYLAYYDLQEKRWISRLDSMNIIAKFNLEDNLIRKLYKTAGGTTWMATGKAGLGSWSENGFPRVAYLKHLAQDIHSISNNNVYDLAEDNKGNLWVSTLGGGLHYLDVNTRNFTQLPETNNMVEGLQIDHHENVWMVSNGNLHRYNPTDKTHASFDLPDSEKTGGVNGKIFKDSQGKLYVAGLNYFISLHPDSISKTSREPVVYFTDFKVFNQSYNHLLQQDKIQVKYKDNHIAFEFSAPDFTPGSNIQYAYRLEGFDKDWVNAGERNYISYSNLQGGDYTFRVRATNTPGQWSSQEAAIVLTVIPPFYMRWWFYLICAILLALAAYGIYRYRINEILNRQTIRNKIAQDLHDNVGSTLSSISVYSQVARIYQQQSKNTELETTLQKISTASGEMISELNDTVWAINPRNDNMQVILQRMESFAKPLLAAQNILFSMQYDQQLPLLNLQMETRKNLFAIFKEAVHNAVKYADCKNFKVAMQYRSGLVMVTLEDDGKGFDLSKTSEGYKSSDTFGGGNGLKNMQQRAKEMKGNLHTETAPGKGTRIQLNFPITRFGDRKYG